MKNRPQTKDEALQLPNASQVALLKKFRNYLEQKRYSTTTIQQYESCVFNFLMWYESKPIEQISINDIRAYNHDAFLKKDKSRSAQNIWISALKLFLEKLEISNIEISEVERPRARTYLPNILSIDEVKELISSYKNLKHKALILTVYSCGLRRSEVLNLKLNDIDSGRGMIRIKNSKGAKDRDIPLPVPLLGLLRAYFKKFKPKEYLFEGSDGGKYSSSSLRSILIQGVRRTKIRKRITLHSLRHSYATHLVEKQINLRYIQEALGHKSSKTTEIYTKLSKDQMSKMISPIDEWENL